MKKQLTAFALLLCALSLQAQQPALYGDLNGDGKITVADFVQIIDNVKKVDKGKVIISNSYGTQYFADVNHDGVVDTKDFISMSTMIVEDVPVQEVNPMLPVLKLPTGITYVGTPSIKLPAGNTKTLTVTIAPADVTDNSLVWSSSNPAIAKVSSQGVVTALSPGSATITVMSAVNYAARATFTVEVEGAAIAEVQPTSVTFNSYNVSLSKGEQCTLSATLQPANATDPSLIWTSSDPRIVFVNQAGVAYGVKDGVATITVTSASNPRLSAKCNVVVDGIFIGGTGTPAARELSKE